MRTNRLVSAMTAVAAMLAGGVLGVAVDVSPAAADWVDNNCFISANTNPLPYQETRANMFWLVFPAVAEGYHWGGGCWNNNDIDDVPGQVPQTTTPRGEGGDCSGFVFKAWGINSANTIGFKLYNPLQYIHGPYVAASYRGNTVAWSVINKANIQFWGTFASTGHIGIMWTHNADGSDLVFEAKGEAWGTNVWNRTYRSDGSYSGAQRNGWGG